MRIEHSVDVKAPADIVWELTVDVTNWPKLSPRTMQKVELLDAGPLRVGSRARIKQPGQSAAVWTVTRLEPRHRFVWHTTRMGVTMTAFHVLEDLGTRCRNTLAIEATGRGARLFQFLFGGAMRKAMQIENAGFQAKAEELSSGRGQTGV